MATGIEYGSVLAGWLITPSKNALIACHFRPGAELSLSGSFHVVVAFRTSRINAGISTVELGALILYSKKPRALSPPSFPPQQELHLEMDQKRSLEM